LHATNFSGTFSTSARCAGSYARGLKDAVVAFTLNLEPRTLGTGGRTLMPRQPQYASPYEWQPREVRPLRFGRVLTAALVLVAGLELGRRTYFAEPSEFNRAQFNAQFNAMQAEPGSVAQTAPVFMARDRPLALSASIAAQAPRTAEATPIAQGSIAGELQPKADERPAAANNQRVRNSAKVRRKEARPESRYARSQYARRSSQQRFYASDDHALRSPIWPGYGGRP